MNATRLFALTLFAVASFVVADATTSARARQAPAGAAQADVPKTTATTPSGCLAEVRAYVDAQNAAAGITGAPITDRALIMQSRRINQARLTMTKECAGRFDAKTVAPSELTAAVQLFGDGNLLEQAQAAIDRALLIKTMGEGERATLIAAAVPVLVRISPPKTDRPWRVAHKYPAIEALADELDANRAATFAQKWAIHSTLASLYRGDDIDAGIIKHGTWILEAAKSFSPESRKTYGGTVVASHVSMAEAYAGQAMTDKALDLLRAAKADWKDLPDIDARVDPTLRRYELVGKPAAAIVAPTWLNAPAGTKSLTLPGQVTLLQFTAHWCGPCRESYPGINRLRERFKGRDFRVVMATRLWGFFDSERNAPAEVEIAKDREYFAAHGLDVVVAVGQMVSTSVVGGKVVYEPGPDPNDTAYEVGAIPQIQLIDKKGAIRLIMVGYDNANEAKLAATIEELLKER